jgi:hypothetical protein
MLKQYFISLTLLFAFSLGLAHDIIPHHHHDEVEDMEHHHHDEEAPAHNHSDHSDHSENSGHHKHDEPLGYFSHISHHITFDEFESSTTQKTSVKVEIDKNLDTDLFITQIALFDNPLSSLELPLGNYHSIFPRNKQFFYAHHFLRGPPAQRS